MANALFMSLFRGETVKLPQDFHRFPRPNKQEAS